jgi:hypothetical protein
MPRTEQVARGGPRHRRRWSARMRILIPLGSALLLARATSAEPPPRGTSREALGGWRYVQELSLPPGRTARLNDFVLPTAVLDGARADLGDLWLNRGPGRPTHIPGIYGGGGAAEPNRCAPASDVMTRRPAWPIVFCPRAGSEVT